MSKKDYNFGSSSVGDFFGWINERHQIYLNKIQGYPKPWTDDPVLRRYKFTNVFRQLDRTTVALNRAIRYSEPPEDVVFNIWWMRLFNLSDHMENLGFVPISEHHRVFEYIRSRHAEGKKIFSGAYMTTGEAGRPKHETYLDAVKDAVSEASNVVEFCKEDGTMQNLCSELTNCFMVGKFVAYELACDFRFVTSLWSDDKPTDTMTWANIGPGAKRGMERLGMEPSVESMRRLLRRSFEALDAHVLLCAWPFELREIEHCLCEFDKYERARTGAGRPRSTYPGE